MHLTVEIEGIDIAVKTFNLLKPYVSQGLKKENLNTAIKIAKRASGLAPRDLGNLEKSIRAKSEIGGISAQTYTNKHYAPYVEYGTSPHFPPPQALAGWAKRHGMAGMEYAIAKKISERGTKAQPFMKPAYMKEKAGHIKRVKAFLREMGT